MTIALKFIPQNIYLASDIDIGLPSQLLEVTV